MSAADDCSHADTRENVGVVTLAGVVRFTLVGHRVKRAARCKVTLSLKKDGT